MWGVVDLRDKDGTMHVTPIMGNGIPDDFHFMDVRCWCGPKITENVDGSCLVVHNQCSRTEH